MRNLGSDMVQSKGTREQLFTRMTDIHTPTGHDHGPLEVSVAPGLRQQHSCRAAAGCDTNLDLFCSPPHARIALLTSRHPLPDHGATPHCDCSYHLSYNEVKPILIPLSSHVAVTKGQLWVGPDATCANAPSPSLGGRVFVVAGRGGFRSKKNSPTGLLASLAHRGLQAKTLPCSRVVLAPKARGSSLGGAGEGGHMQAPGWGVSIWFMYSPHSDTLQVFIP